jgi:hypothetical protein
MWTICELQTAVLLRCEGDGGRTCADLLLPRSHDKQHNRFLERAVEHHRGNTYLYFANYSPLARVDAAAHNLLLFLPAACLCGKEEANTHRVTAPRPVFLAQDDTSHNCMRRWGALEQQLIVEDKELLVLLVYVVCMLQQRTNRCCSVNAARGGKQADGEMK